ncbi:MAG TPA: tripartite tricarboxylate transporter substrate binding protein [Ramlibacter sp.]|uniref:Bug family tripartite tricarboxylate transporter substrate binding protein n=1 Tax=Ramlibacter sp. TaxID=1917967 RepID=UPI002D7EE7A3|nr:tripartite tricarboxylate transporter substrate binding protein [Ramlibacter sp.]HET8745420.1 tripartite tricarboxylate transporter substrate binding protein [Ramlibacter sp.]
MNKREVLRLCALAAAPLLPLAGAQAQDASFPPRTITIVVGFAAGGAADVAARLIGKRLGDNLGVPVVIDNKPGAGGNIAHQYVAKTAPSDGSVILFGSVGPLTIAPHLMKLPYDPVKDFAPITMGVNFPNVLVVHSGLPIKTFAEFVAYAKASPGKLDFASTGPGSASHLAGELLNDMAKIQTVHIPYKGGAPALQDLLGGRVASYYSTFATAQPHIESGKLIPLAVTGPTRLATLPKVPTLAEAGYPGYSATNWYAFVASSRVPKAILDRYNTELVKVLKTPEIVRALEAHGLPPQPGSREELARTMERESATWGRVIRERRITNG